MNAIYVFLLLCHLIFSNESATVTNITQQVLSNKTILVPKSFHLRVQQSSLTNSVKSRIIFPPETKYVILFRNSSISNAKSEKRNQKCNPVRFGFENLMWMNEVKIDHSWNYFFTDEENHLDFILLKRPKLNDFWILYELERFGCDKTSSVVDITGIAASESRSLLDVSWPKQIHFTDSDGVTFNLSVNYYMQPYIRHLLRILEANGGMQLKKSFLLHDFGTKVFNEMKNNDIRRMFLKIVTIVSSFSDILDKPLRRIKNEILPTFFPYATFDESVSIQLDVMMDHVAKGICKYGLKYYFQLFPLPEIEKKQYENLFWQSFNNQAEKMRLLLKLSAKQTFKIPSAYMKKFTKSVMADLEQEKLPLLEEQLSDYVENLKVFYETVDSKFYTDFQPHYLSDVDENQLRNFKYQFLMQYFEDLMLLILKTYFKYSYWGGIDLNDAKYWDSYEIYLAQSFRTIETLVANRLNGLNW